jgi:hypothetical protein
MSKYQNKLRQLFNACIIDDSVIAKLSVQEKAKFRGFRHRVLHHRSISEQAMRETIEKYYGAKIMITAWNTR